VGLLYIADTVAGRCLWVFIGLPSAEDGVYLHSLLLTSGEWGSSLHGRWPRPAVVNEVG
jgi:hypothetical protein